jgi:hypothetical protein
MTVMVRDDQNESAATPARVEVRATYDLYISSCRIEPLNSYEWYKGEVTVTNHGTNTAPASLAGRSTIVEYDSHPDKGGMTVILAPDGGLYLAPGQSWTYQIGSITFSPDPQPSTQTFRIRPRDDERSHANNDRTCSVPPHPGTPSPPPSLADLTVSQVSVTPLSGPPSTEFVVTVTVANQGEAAFQSSGSQPVWVRCTIPDEIEYLGSLAPGATETFTLPVTHQLTPGDKETTCTVDPFPSKVDESDEDNNSRTASFVVTPPQR